MTPSTSGFLSTSVFIPLGKIGAARQQATKSNDKTSVYKPLTALGFSCFLREEAI